MQIDFQGSTCLFSRHLPADRRWRKKPWGLQPVGAICMDCVLGFFWFHVLSVHVLSPSPCSPWSGIASFPDPQTWRLRSIFGRLPRRLGTKGAQKRGGQLRAASFWLLPKCDPGHSYGGVGPESFRGVWGRTRTNP